MKIHLFLIPLILLSILFPIRCLADFPLVDYSFDQKMPDGYFVKTLPDSKVKIVEGYFNSGKKTGFWTYYYGTKQIKQEEGSYKDDKREGPWTTWYENGNLAARGNFERGEMTGFWVLRNSDGTRQAEGNYKNGQRSGIWHWWHPDGQISSEGAYENGIQKGWWTFWYENGQVKSKVDMTPETSRGIDSERKENSFYDEDGKSIEYKTWVEPAFDVADIRIDKQKNCQFFSLYSSGDRPRLEYIQRPSDTKPILFYRYERAIDATLGNKGRLVLVNDIPATKSSEILIVDLMTKKKWHIDNQVIHRYHQDVNSKDYCVLPQPVGFSPDDQKVLIQMVIGYCYKYQPGISERFEKKYDMWAYVVDSKSGNILREFRDKKLPENWWAEKQ